jgi:secreted trypsin-like serine protease
LIYGGKEVKRGEWPWIVAFAYKPRNTFFCGGNLISNKHILSGKKKIDKNSKMTCDSIFMFLSCAMFLHQRLS